MKLCIEKSTWSGWDSEETPENEIFEFEVELGKEYIVDEIEADSDHGAKIFSFTITKVRDRYIEIKTSTKMINSFDDDMEASEGNDVFKVEIGKTLEITTPTLDEGDTYRFNLK